MKSGRQGPALWMLLLFMLGAGSGCGGGGSNSPPVTTETPPQLSLLAGNPNGPGSTDGVGTAARFQGPVGIALDGSGNIYVADTGNHIIRKIVPSGMVTTLAGTAGAAHSGATDGTGPAASFLDPKGAASDSFGNVYVADAGNNTIRKISPTGVVTTLAGNANSSGSLDGAGSAASFFDPTGIAVDGSGNVYVADRGNNTIRKINPAGIVTTLAGSATAAGFADGTASAARFDSPTGVALDATGNLYVADYGNDTIRKIAPGGVVTTLAGNPGVAGSADGIGSTATFHGPHGVSVDASGNVYVADYGNDTIRRITMAGVVTTLAGKAGLVGSVDGLGAQASFYGPGGLVVDPAGNVYVTDTVNNAIRKITPAGKVTTLAGLAAGFGSADGAGPAASFNGPGGVAVDSLGKVYVADTGNSIIRTISPAGEVSTLAGTAGVPGLVDGAGAAARFSKPCCVAVDALGNLYVSDSGNNAIRKISPAGLVITLANPKPLYVTSPPGCQNGFSNPGGIAVDGKGTVYVSDYGNGLVCTITSSGVVSGAGPYQPGSLGLPRPYGLAVDASGNVFIPDSSGSTVSKLSGLNLVNLAGDPANFGSADGLGTAARFAVPTGAAVDDLGNVYIADHFNGLTYDALLKTVRNIDYGVTAIRKVSPAGAVSTVIGSVNMGGYSAQGLSGTVGSTALALPGTVGFPGGMAMSADHALYFTQNNAVMKISGVP